MTIGTNNWDVETYKKKLEKAAPGKKSLHFFCPGSRAAIPPGSPLNFPSHSPHSIVICTFFLNCYTFLYPCISLFKSLSGGGSLHILSSSVMVWH